MLTLTKHSFVKKFFKFLLLLSESDYTRPLNMFDHFEIAEAIDRERKETATAFLKNSFRDFKTPYE